MCLIRLGSRHHENKSIRQGAGTPTPTYGFLRQGVLGSENKHRAFCALSGHLSAVTSAAVKVTTAQAGKLHPTLAFEKRQETCSPMKARVSMVRAAALRCTLKRSQCGCAVRIGLAVEESLHLAQALSQKGALLTKKPSRLKPTGCRGVTPVRDVAARAKKSSQKSPRADFYTKKFVFSKAPPMTRTTFEKNFFVVKFTRLIKINFCNFSRFLMVAQVFFGVCAHVRHLPTNSPQGL